jgi:putative phosphoesterase
MLKLMVASDSHNSSYVERFALLCRGCDQVVFLGDVLEDAEKIQRELGAPVLKVAGNCDHFSREARQICINLEGVKTLMVHGDAEHVKYGLDRLAYRAAELNARLALFGHTHRPCVEERGGVLLVNPGALKNRSYAEIVIDGENIAPKLLTL